MKISKQAIMRKSGWTEQQYKREYAKFSAKVKNLNRLTNSHYNASNELYYSLVEPENATIRAIQEMSSTRKGTTQRMKDVAYDYVVNRWKGLINASPEIKEQFEQIGKRVKTASGKTRKYTIKNFNAYAKRFVKNVEKNRRLDPLYSYETFNNDFEQTEEDGPVFEANEEDYSSIF